MQTEQQQEVRAHIRWMIRRDMPEVLTNEGKSFEFPGSDDEFIRCLRHRNYIGVRSCGAITPIRRKAFV